MKESEEKFKMKSEEIINFSEDMLVQQQRKMWRADYQSRKNPENLRLKTAVESYRKNVNYLKAVIKKFKEK